MVTIWLIAALLDDFDPIQLPRNRQADSIDVVIATGARGDRTRWLPEAFDLFLKNEGFIELFRYVHFKKLALQRFDEAFAEVAGGTYLLPYGVYSCRDAWDEICVITNIVTPRNFVEIMPRLDESATVRRGG